MQTENGRNEPVPGEEPDPDVRQAHEAGEAQEPAGAPVAVAPTEPAAPRAGEGADAVEIEDIIKDYRILSTVNETSTSIVYKAEEKQSRRKVAIKIIYNRSIPDLDRINRANVEIERLRHLYHPGIAPLMRAGTTEEGHCFFVSQFVKGVSLKEYIGIHNLGLGERLSVFVKLCDALNYAHQRCLLHRDLRPSNILVDGKCNPILVGYGVAVVTDVDVGTSSSGLAKRELREFLAYKSPEQAAGQLYDIDIRSDVYSLGVILYELLTDRMPYEFRSEDGKALLQTIVREMPAKPGSIRPSLPRDLEAIALKALEKAPAARYQSVSQLAQDLDRYFEKRPVEARPAGAFYEFRKLAARHRSRFISVVLMSAAVLLFGLHVHVTTRQAGERRLQEQRQRTAEEIAHRLSAEQLARQKETELQTALAAEQTRRQKAEIRSASLRDDLAAAREALEEARAQSERAEASLAAAGEITRFWPALFQAREPRAAGGAALTAEDVLSRGARAVSEAFADEPLIRAELINDLGIAFRNLGRAEEAAELAKQAWELRTETLGEMHEDTVASLNNLAAALFAQGRHQEAEPPCRDLVRIATENFGPEDPRTLTAMNNLAMALHAAGKLEEAGDLLRRTVDGRRRVLGETHHKTGLSLRELALILQEQGEAQEAADLFRASRTVFEQALSEGHWLLADTDSRLGECLTKLGRFDEAEPLLLEAHQALEDRLGRDRPQTRAARARIVALYEAWSRQDQADAWRARR